MSNATLVPGSRGPRPPGPNANVITPPRPGGVPPIMAAVTQQNSNAPKDSTRKVIIESSYNTGKYCFDLDKIKQNYEIDYSFDEHKDKKKNSINKKGEEFYNGVVGIIAVTNDGKIGLCDKKSIFGFYQEAKKDDKILPGQTLYCGFIFLDYTVINKRAVIYVFEEGKLVTKFTCVTSDVKIGTKGGIAIPRLKKGAELEISIDVSTGEATITKVNDFYIRIDPEEDRLALGTKIYFPPCFSVTVEK